MQKANQEIKDKAVIENILQSSTICRIAMLDGEKPYLLPFNYGYSENTIYIHSANKGKKLDVLRKNPHVCFEIDQSVSLVKNQIACKWATTYQSILGYGNIELLTVAKQKEDALNIIMQQHGAESISIFNPKHIDALTILKLNITQLSGKQSSNWEEANKYILHSIESKRLDLNEISLNDVDHIHTLHSLPEVDRYNTLGIPENIRISEKLINTSLEAQKQVPRKHIHWCIRLKSDNRFIGEAGINLSADRFKLGEIYYNLLPEFWNKGYATELAKALINYGFKYLNLHKIEAGVATENMASIKVLEKAGMTREGLRRKILPIRGEWKDNYHYAIVENDLH
ncbi:GNAT family N-acetyltransferase [Carboxylicivirga sp. N1Y90]|uniref:GNAT family N-acetyltransferase n=1 Tax=Carboxylicivirga fragile TaxID=3417571 RepID=UPI003D3455E0|nr:GNAT family N-acetyltransferase [Marinilabiliaceae bacterium N1Y90]